MALQIQSPRFSFIRLTQATPESYNTCSDTTVGFCLPVYAYTDIAFQFVVTGTQAEIDDICDLNNDLIKVGLISTCFDNDGLYDISDTFDVDFKATYGLKPARARISATEMLYMWSHGLPGFSVPYEIGDCFVIKVYLDPGGVYDPVQACSNCLQRIGYDCYTSVLEYGAAENQFEFNYCGAGGLFGDDEQAEPCASPMIVQFTDALEIDIPYTAAMQAAYGDVPSVEIWILEGGEYVQAMIRAGFDAYPPTRIIADLGGAASGFVKIS